MIFKNPEIFLKKRFLRLTIERKRIFDETTKLVNKLIQPKVWIRSFPFPTILLAGITGILISNELSISKIPRSNQANNSQSNLGLKSNFLKILIAAIFRKNKKNN